MKNKFLLMLALIFLLPIVGLCQNDVPEIEKRLKDLIIEVDGVICEKVYAEGKTPSEAFRKAEAKLPENIRYYHLVLAIKFEEKLYVALCFKPQNR